MRCRSRCARSFCNQLGGLPQIKGAPPAKILGRIEADDYIIEKLDCESSPGYFVSALLYKPKTITGRLPGVISPCGHSPEGKAAATYQILHINLVKRGYIVLTYDPVGQGERSQFWDAEKKQVALQSRLRRTCGPRQSALPAWDQPGPLSHLGRHPRHRLPRVAAGSRYRAHRLRRQLRGRHAHRVHLRPRPAREGGGHRLLHHDAAAAHGQSHPGRPGRRSRAGHLRLRQRRHRSCRLARLARAAADAAGDRAIRFFPHRRRPRIVCRGEETVPDRRRGRAHGHGGGGREARPVAAAAQGDLRLLRPLAGRTNGRRRQQRDRGEAPAGKGTARLQGWPGQRDVSIAALVDAGS